MRFALGAALAAAALTACTLGAGAAHAFTPDTKTLKDWTAVCSNLGSCEAFGFTPDDGTSSIFLKITRAAGPTAQPTALLVFDPGDTQPDQRWTLTVDGKPTPGIESVVAHGGADGARARLTATQTAALIGLLRAGQQLTVCQDDNPIGVISLAGSAATLLWMDDFQGRAGGVTALVAKGPKPASAVPPPVAPPVIAAAPTVSQANLPKLAPRRLIVGIQDCDIRQDPNVTTPDDVVVRLAPGVVLWAPECSMAAYNELTALFLGDEHGAHTQPLSLPGSDGRPRDNNELTNMTYDRKTGILAQFDRARGPGDCGEQDEWVWDGRAFQLLDEHLMSECHDVMIQDWPPVYVAHRR